VEECSGEQEERSGKQRGGGTLRKTEMRRNALEYREEEERTGIQSRGITLQIGGGTLQKTERRRNAPLQFTVISSIPFYFTSLRK
jgi:hypothetical protein